MSRLRCRAISTAWSTDSCTALFLISKAGASVGGDGCRNELMRIVFARVAAAAGTAASSRAASGSASL